MATVVIAGYATCSPTDEAPLGCGGVKNVNPVLDLPAVPLKTVSNGQSWIMQQDTNMVYIARVKGSAYEMGYAYGELFGDKLALEFQHLVDYGRGIVVKFLTDIGVPYITTDLIFSQLLNLGFYALDTNWAIAKPFIPQRWIDEL